MSPNPPSPLTPEHYDLINQGLTAIYNARQLIGKAQQAGYDTRVHTEQTNHLEQQLTALKSAFFPRGRTSP